MSYSYIIRTATLALLISAIRCQPPSEQALDDLIREIFTMAPVNGSPPNPSIPPTPSTPAEQPSRGPDTYVPNNPIDQHVPEPHQPTNPGPVEENVCETMMKLDAMHRRIMQ